MNGTDLAKSSTARKVVGSPGVAAAVAGMGTFGTSVTAQTTYGWTKESAHTGSFSC